MENINGEELKKHLKILQELGFEEIILDKEYFSNE